MGVERVVMEDEVSDGMYDDNGEVGRGGEFCHICEK